MLKIKHKDMFQRQRCHQHLSFLLSSYTKGRKETFIKKEMPRIKMKRYYVRFFTMDAVKKKEIRAGGQTDVQIFWFSIGIFL